MTKIVIETTFTLDPELFEDILDIAGYGIGYWVESASIELISDDSDEIIYRIKEQDGDEFILTRNDLEATIFKIVSDPTIEINRSLRNDLTLLCIGRDEDIDIDTADADQLIQIACFNEIIYA